MSLGASPAPREFFCLIIGAMRFRVACPAKVNLFLAVGKKDARGYHPLRTIFQAIGTYDFIEIDTEARATTVEFWGAGIPENNTVTKALRLMAEYTDIPPMKIEVFKDIPSEAGLGGGSSDAAGIIRAVRYLIPSMFSERDAMTVAQAVGADVPFFLVGGRAKGEGYGEVLTPLDDPAPAWVVVVKPTIGCSTPAMYASLDEKDYEWRDFPTDDELYNDFERVAPCECLDLIERLQVLGAKQAGLSGSGSAVFGIFESEEAAFEADDKIRDGRMAVWHAPFLTRRESQYLAEFTA